MISYQVYVTQTCDGETEITQVQVALDPHTTPDTGPVST